MTNLAPVAAPVVSREIAPGVSVHSGMTPQQRFEIIARNTAGVTVTSPQAAPQWHTDATMTHLANLKRDAEAKPPAERAKIAAESAMDAAIKAACDARNAEGFAPAAAITGPALFGYTLPAGREYHVADTIYHLRMARVGGLSQAQVNAIILAGV